MAGRTVSVEPRRLLVLGPGYSASAAIEHLRRPGTTISVTARSDAAASALAASEVAPIRFDGTAAAPALSMAVAGATHILASIPPGDDGDPFLRHHAGDLAAAPSLRAVVYLSTVGVYGDHDGAWVDETTAPRPASLRSVRRVAAEEAWRAAVAAAGRPLAILRLAGIYGPGRSALDSLADGTARRITKPGQVFNRIHVADIATAVAATFARQAAGSFNVTDDEPSPPQDVIAFAAGLVGVATPPDIPFAEAELSAMARSFYGENKRVRNDLMKEALGMRLRYPTYREGLRGLAAGG